MKEAFEKIRKRLESVWRLKVPNGNIGRTFYIPLQDALSIVSEVEAEFGKDINVRGNGWIPCSERLPKEATVYEVTEEIIICSQKQYIVEHRLFGTEGEWLCPSNRKVIAWMPLQSPYKPTND